MTTNAHSRLRRALLVLGLAPAAAWATPNFPAALQRELSLPAAPACTLCHQGPTAVGTVVTPFGTAMRGHGLVFYDEAALASALTLLQQEGVDSDGDGVPDIDELRAGEDPNRAPPREGEVALLAPRYGCSSTGSNGGALGGALGAVLLVLGALARGGRLRTRVGTAQGAVPTGVDSTAGGPTSFRALAAQARRHRPCS